MRNSFRSSESCYLKSCAGLRSCWPYRSLSSSCFWSFYGNQEWFESASHLPEPLRLHRNRRSAGCKSSALAFASSTLSAGFAVWERMSEEIESWLDDKLTIESTSADCCIDSSILKEISKLNRRLKVRSFDWLTDIAVDLIVIDRVVRIIRRIVVARIVEVLVLLDLSLLRYVVRVRRRWRLLDSVIAKQFNQRKLTHVRCAIQFHFRSRFASRLPVRQFFVNFSQVGSFGRHFEFQVSSVRSDCVNFSSGGLTARLYSCGARGLLAV